MYLVFIFLVSVFSESKTLLNKNFLEDHIESKRKLVLSIGMLSPISNSLHKTDTNTSKNGIFLSVGFEIFRDKLLWDFFYTYIPRSRYSDTLVTSVNDFGFELKGMQAFSRYYSLYASLGLLSRQEIKDYTAYLIGSGIDFNINSSLTVSSSIVYKASLKNFTETELAVSKDLAYLIKLAFNI